MPPASFSMRQLIIGGAYGVDPTPFRSMIAIEIRMSPAVFESSGDGLSVQFT